MTDKPRMSLVMDAELEAQLIELRKSDKFCRCSLAEIMRQCMKAGLKLVAENGAEEQA